MMRRDEINSCGAVVFAQGGDELFVLMVRHSPGWSFPKGHMEPGETEEQTAVRETFEETGISIRILSPQSCRVPSVYAHERREIIFFLAESLTGRQTPRVQEVLDAAWVPVEQASEHISYAPDRTVLEDMLVLRNTLWEANESC